MKLLQITASGLSLLKEKIVIDFFAEQRVMNDNKEMLSKVFRNTYTNNVLSFVGINASGKTTLLKLISFVIDIINGTPINMINHRDVLTDSKNVTIEAVFFNDEFGLCKLSSKIKRVDTTLETRFYFEKEVLWRKNVSKVVSKKDITKFGNELIYMKRNDQERFLQDDISIVVIISKNDRLFVADLINYTNHNILRLLGNFSRELIDLLDPSIESVNYDMKTGVATLKFYGKEKIKISSYQMLEHYLSSGTIKGINTFLLAIQILKYGGYLLIDEIENHFNREIVATLIRFFTSDTVNKRGATLLFSTHYSELLDEFDRSDDIYIVRNKGGITMQKLCEVLKRNDIKKSDAFKSDYLEGTVPSYDAYIALKDKIIGSMS